MSYTKTWDIIMGSKNEISGGFVVTLYTLKEMQDMRPKIENGNGSAGMLKTFDFAPKIGNWEFSVEK